MNTTRGTGLAVFGYSGSLQYAKAFEREGDRTFRIYLVPYACRLHPAASLIAIRRACNISPEGGLGNWDRKDYRLSSYGNIS